jgi:hypothetical protein
MDLQIPPYSNALSGFKVTLFEELLQAFFFQFLQLQGGTRSNSRKLDKPSSFFRRNKHIPCKSGSSGCRNSCIMVLGPIP